MGSRGGGGCETNPQPAPSSDSDQSLLSGGVLGHSDSPELLFWVQAYQQSLPLLGRCYDGGSVSAVGVKAVLKAHYVLSVLFTVDKRKVNFSEEERAQLIDVPKTATVLLEFFIKRESKVSLMRDPLSHFCQEEVVLHAQECMLKLNKQVITYQDLRDMVENLVGLHSLCIKKDPEVAKALGVTVRKLIIITGEVASSLEKIAEVSVTDWMAIGDAIITKIERMQLTKPQPFSSFIPKIRDFHSIKMLGAGGFGAVYLANYRPANFVATVKLVNVDRFSRHKQAAMDKVVASVIRNPFLVKYYSCFCVKEAYVTIMEYIAGLDLMRVVTKEEYLDIECSQIIMAQLILALEHMHLRGFLHRDIKVSNMLILPGGRVKVIDFDTTKVCSGHCENNCTVLSFQRVVIELTLPRRFTSICCACRLLAVSKRLLRGYFRRTPFEFHDGESAGTIPYMAPEILKRRPYGRAADWWSAGIVLYKLTTGRVPFRGKTKQALRERIITSPLKFPRTEDHPHSATAPAKDMMYRMLKKNPVERLGSRNYSDLKTHPFFEQFDWQMLYNRTNLCEISSIAEILKADAEKGNEPDPDDQRRHLTIDEMTDIAFDTQRPLLCYASGSFKKLMNTVRESKTAINISPTFMDTSGFSTTPVDYRAATPGQSSIKTGLASTANEKKEGPSSSIGKVELILFRKKKYWKYWSFGFSMRRVKGEDDNFYLYVDGVKKDSPADRSQVLPLDVILSVNGTHVEDVAQARKALSACSDQLVLSVMSSSTYRVLTSRRDMMSLIRCLPKETAVLKSMPFSCITGMPYGLGVIDVSVWDDKAKRFTTVFVLTHTDVTPVGSDTVYPGDVLAQIDGVNLEGLMRDQVMQMLNTTSGDVTVSVVPMSPMRVRRILVSKLHETVMTDTNVASRTTGADIESL
nr:microtubule-associated serine/threonine-protein kinase 3-like [Dermacentor andersoni]